MVFGAEDFAVPALFLDFDPPVSFATFGLLL